VRFQKGSAPCLPPLLPRWPAGCEGKGGPRHIREPSSDPPAGSPCVERSESAPAGFRQFGGEGRHPFLSPGGVRSEPRKLEMPSISRRITLRPSELFSRPDLCDKHRLISHHTPSESKRVSGNLTFHGDNQHAPQATSLIF
jgi:hypothetical protein